MENYIEEVDTNKLDKVSIDKYMNTAIMDSKLARAVYNGHEINIARPYDAILIKPRNVSIDIYDILDLSETKIEDIKADELVTDINPYIDLGADSIESIKSRLKEVALWMMYSYAIEVKELKADSPELDRVDVQAEVLSKMVPFYVFAMGILYAAEAHISNTICMIPTKRDTLSHVCDTIMYICGSTGFFSDKKNTIIKMIYHLDRKIPVASRYISSIDSYILWVMIKHVLRVERDESKLTDTELVDRLFINNTESVFKNEISISPEAFVRKRNPSVLIPLNKLVDLSKTLSSRLTYIRKQRIEIEKFNRRYAGQTVEDRDAKLRAAEEKRERKLKSRISKG